MDDNLEYSEYTETDFFDDAETDGNTENTETEIDNKEYVDKSKNTKNNKTKKKKKSNEPVEKDKVRLFFLMDKDNPKILEYARNCGLNISKIFDNTSSLRDFLMINDELSRIVIVESGTGKFITPKIRKTIIDVISLADENQRFTVFYSNNVLKTDTLNEVGKNLKIDWIEYESTIKLVAEMLRYNEEYISSDYYDNPSSNDSKLFEFKGVNTGIKDGKNVPSIITAESVRLANSENSTYEQVPGYNIRY
ncbi:MAG: hypothetical protein IJ593_05240 [Lachnospiraceae bacterium]|nr:hypothetical protein [Lachnospiraceae bacterium]